MALKNDDDFIRELRNDFKIEAAEHLQELSDLLLLLEKSEGQQHQQIVETVFRATHSLKGAARAVNLLHIEQLCMAWEDLLHGIKDQKISLEPSMIDLFFKALDLLQEWIKDIEAEPTLSQSNQLGEITSSLKDFQFGERPKERQSLFFDLDDAPPTTEAPTRSEPLNTLETEEPLPHAPAASTPPPVVQNDPKPNTAETRHHASDTETIRIPISRLTDLLSKAEELVVMNNMLMFQQQMLSDSYGDVSQWYIKQLRSNEKLLLRDDGVASFLQSHIRKLGMINTSFAQLERNATKDIDALLFDVKRSLLQPFSSLTAVVPKIVRDLSKLYNKDVELHLEGLEIELDRRILESLKDPLIHLVRNAIDHGVESLDERKKTKKQPRANLWISMKQNEQQKLLLTIRDDGKGINKSKLLKSAVKNGLISEKESQALSDKEVYGLIFKSGVSTTEFITDISGRGLGMAIVAEKVHEIGGTIDIESVEGYGTSFFITLPQTLASFRGVLIDVAGQRFMIPTQSIFAAKRYLKTEIQTVESKSVIIYQDERLAIVHLAELLGLRIKRLASDKNQYLRCLMLSDGHRKFAVIVDEVFGEFSGVLKSFGTHLVKLKTFSGAILMGDGKVVPVLNVSELLQLASSRSVSMADTIQPVSAEDASAEQHILIAEDSITVRNMLRNMLESAGYNVKTAVDGQQALELLKEETFDLLVSDVEMPRMNGFELTRSVRSNPNLADMPVILVTALESNEDRQKGLEAGASAYIVKGSFEKSNLIETINRLI